MRFPWTEHPVGPQGFRDNWGSGEAAAHVRRRTHTARRPATQAPIDYLAGLLSDQLLDRLPVPILAVHQDGTVVHANVAFHQMLGYQRSALIDRSADWLFTRPTPTEWGSCLPARGGWRCRHLASYRPIDRQGAGQPIRVGSQGRSGGVGRVCRRDRAIVDRGSSHRIPLERPQPTTGSSPNDHRGPCDRLAGVPRWQQPADERVLGNRLGRHRMVAIRLT